MPRSRLLAGFRILFVDDHEDSRELFAFVLVNAGAEVRKASGATEARAVISQWMPDLLISDLNMPEEDGFSLIKSIRANPATCALPAVALTGHAEDDARVRALESGFQLRITKPVDVAAFVLAIVGLLVPAGRPLPNAA